jgi:hypothetical protein
VFGVPLLSLDDRVAVAYISSLSPFWGYFLLSLVLKERCCP